MNTKENATNPNSTVIAAEKLHQQRFSNSHSLTSDPMLEPIIQAAKELQAKIKEQTRQEIEVIKKETADQTKKLYLHVSDAKKEFKRLEQQYSEKCGEYSVIKHQKLQLEDEISKLVDHQEKQQQDISHLKTQLNQKDQEHHHKLSTITDDNENLITRLKNKITQINTDFERQITNLQQKLDYQQQQLENENKSLQSEISKLSEQVTQLTLEKKANEQQYIAAQQQVSTLQHEAETTKQELTEKSGKLTSAEHAQHLANEELNRSRLYIEELEKKNNSIQQELFENWIHKKEETI